MSLLDDLAAEQRPNRPQCKMCDIIDALPEEESEQVEASLKGKIAHRALSRVLTKNGWPIGANAITKHVNEEHA